jgi:hypothetical protein
MNEVRTHNFIDGYTQNDKDIIRMNHPEKPANQNTVLNIPCYDWMIVEYEYNVLLLESIVTNSSELNLFAALILGQPAR